MGYKRKEERGSQHVQATTWLLGEIIKAEQAIVLDKDGKELNRIVLFDDVSLPTLPEDGRVERVPIARIMANTDFLQRPSPSRACCATNRAARGCSVHQR